MCLLTSRMAEKFPDVTAKKKPMLNLFALVNDIDLVTNENILIFGVSTNSIPTFPPLAANSTYLRPDSAI